MPPAARGLPHEPPEFPHQRRSAVPEHALSHSSSLSLLYRFNNSAHALGLLFMLPAAAILLVFLTYPLGLGMWLGLTDTKIGRSGVFVGLANYESLFKDSVFWLSVMNTIGYTAGASLFKFALG